jgi:hypothetical protein
MAQVEKLLIFLASPGDVPSERRYVQEVVDDLNRTVASRKGIVLQVVSWENDAFPGYGMDAQALINAQIAEMAKYSLFVGIMWNRLGTPTPRAASGTVEEFERAVMALAQHGQPAIWFYFCEAPANLDTEEQLEQRKNVLEFRKRFQANGLSWLYKRPPDFKNKFRNQMTLWLNSLDREQGNKSTTYIPPKAYHVLVGRQDEIDKIMGALREPKSKPVIFIAGLGGIGKTALVREVVERCREEGSFKHFVWASFKTELFVGEHIIQTERSAYSFDELVRDIARQCTVADITQMPADQKQAMDITKMPPDRMLAKVKDLLNKERVLIVLDNLENIPDSETLIAKVCEILGQGKLLITSRHHVKLEVYNIDLSGLKEDAGVTLLRDESQERGIEIVADADRSILVEIHHVVGGAPLAMKLVIGQMSRQPMAVVLETLQKVKFAGQSYDIYRFIYQYSWKMLDMNARMVLVDMSVFPPLKGGAVKDVESISQVRGPAFWLAMDQLVRLSLVDKIGWAGKERFALHPLTQYFIRSDITNEQEWAK